MTTEEIIQRLVRYLSNVYYRQWQGWELLVIALTCAFALVLIVIARRKAIVKVRCLPEYEPVIGTRLIGRSRRRIMPDRWKGYLFIILFMSLSFAALWLYVLRPRPRLEAEPAARLVAANLGNTVVSVGRNLVAETEATIDTKVDPFVKKYEDVYAKYKNKYALLAFSNEFVELPDFNQQQESKWYKHGDKDTERPLPDWETGQYGSVPPRRIVQILGPDEMLVAGLFSESGRLVRFRGWLTAGLRKGQIWPETQKADPNEQTEPLEVAVEGQYTYRTILGQSITVPSVVPLKLFREGITPEQFRNLLLTGTALPEELRQFNSQLQNREAVLSDEKPLRTNKASF